MKRTIYIWGIALISALALLSLACSSNSTISNTPANPSATPLSAATSTPTTSSSTAGGLTVNVKDSGTMGKILTGSNGRTLYRFDRDTTPGTSACTGACTQTWPALLLTQGDPKGSSDLVGKLDTFNRQDPVGRQVTYNGSPLYYFATDTQPGDTKGDGVGGVWHAVQPKAP